jgi:hypothetical protein
MESQTLRNDDFLNNMNVEVTTMMILGLFLMPIFHEILFYQLVEQFRLQEFNVCQYCMRKSKK